MKSLAFLCLFLFAGVLMAAGNVWTQARKLDFAVLPDAGYTLERLLADSTLPFVAMDTLHPQLLQQYWVKITLQPDSVPPGDYYLTVGPPIDNTLYFLDTEVGEWRSVRNGMLVGAGMRHGKLPFRHNRAGGATIYVHMDLHDFGKGVSNFRPYCFLDQAAFVDQKEDFLWTAWLVTLVIICVYIFNIATDSLAVRDRSSLFYLLVLVGSLLYITGFHKFNLALWDYRVVRFSVLSDFSFLSFDLGGLVMHLGVLLIMVGYAQLARRFLDSASHLPKLDKVLKWSLMVFLLVDAAALIVTYASPWYIIARFLVYSNLYLIGLFVLIFTMSLLSLKHVRRNARLFLMTNAAPFLVGIVSAVYLNLYYYDSYGMLLLPFIGVASFAITFAIALSVRNRDVRNDLQAKELHNEQIQSQLALEQLERENLALRHREVEHELYLERLETENLQLLVDSKNREIVSSSINITQKNDVMERIKKELEAYALAAGTADTKPLQNIQSLVRNNSDMERTWDNFKIHFEQVHPDFFQSLQQEHSDLTANELKLCAFLKLNLTNKEIARIQNIDPASVKRAKIRLKKKLNPAAAVDGLGDESE